jgi:ElaB/YqjD/DUF883 family membrane-anchored ribosome-binding protein
LAEATIIEKVDLAKSKASSWDSELRDSIVEKPIRSVAIASGLGILLGLFLRRS